MSEKTWDFSLGLHEEVVRSTGHLEDLIALIRRAVKNGCDFRVEASFIEMGPSGYIFDFRSEPHFEDC